MLPEWETGEVGVSWCLERSAWLQAWRNDPTCHHSVIDAQSAHQLVMLLPIIQEFGAVGIHSCWILHTARALCVGQHSCDLVHSGLTERVGGGVSAATRIRKVGGLEGLTSEESVYQQGSPFAPAWWHPG